MIFSVSCDQSGQNSLDNREESTHTAKAIALDTAVAKRRRCVGQFIGLSGSFAPRVCESISEAMGGVDILPIISSALSLWAIMGICSACWSIAGVNVGRAVIGDATVKNKRRQGTIGRLDDGRKGRLLVIMKSPPEGLTILIYIASHHQLLG